MNNWIVIHIEGGVASVFQKPKGINVILVDFDNIKDRNCDGNRSGSVEHYEADIQVINGKEKRHCR